MVAACDLGADSIAPRTRPPLETLEERLDASPPRAAPQRSCIVVVAVVGVKKRRKMSSLLLSSRKGKKEKKKKKNCGGALIFFSFFFLFFSSDPRLLFLLSANDGSRVDSLAFLFRSGERGSVELSVIWSFSEDSKRRHGPEEEGEKGSDRVFAVVQSMDSSRCSVGVWPPTLLVGTDCSRWPGTEESCFITSCPRLRETALKLPC